MTKLAIMILFGLGSLLFSVGIALYKLAKKLKQQKGIILKQRIIHSIQCKSCVFMAEIKEMSDIDKEHLITTFHNLEGDTS